MDGSHRVDSRGAMEPPRPAAPPAGASRGFVHRYAVDTSRPTRQQWLRDIALRGLLPAVALLGVVWLVGWIVVGPLGGLAGEDQINVALQRHRTQPLNLLALIVSHAAGVVVAPLTALVAFWVLRRRTGQWWLAIVPLLSVGLEALVYQSAALLVGRGRPEGVAQLDFGIRSGSFPSGHVGASVCLMLVFTFLVFGSGGSRAARVTMVVLTVLWPVAVAVSRLYLGMHHVSDMVAGAIIGVLCAFLGWFALRRETPATVRT